MTREFIMQVQIDDDGHEYDMTLVQELVRCKDCKHLYVEPYLFHDYHMEGYIKHMCRFSEREIPTGDYYCRLGERRMS